MRRTLAVLPVAVRMLSQVQTEVQTAKAWLFLILAIVSSLVINLSPVAIGVYLYLAGEGIGKALLAAIALYVWYAALTSYLGPAMVIIYFIRTWLKEGFFPALVWTLVLTLGTLILLDLPEWFLSAAYRAAMQVPDRSSWDIGE